MADTNWTDDMLKTLRELWPTKETAAAIGAKLGVSKNVVIGKANRLNLGRKTHRRPPSPPRPKVSQPPKLLVTPEEILKPAVEPGVFPETGKCKFMHGHPHDANWQFCGHETESGKPYCPTHAARLYVPNVVGKVRT